MNGTGRADDGGGERSGAYQKFATAQFGHVVSTEKMDELYSVAGTTTRDRESKEALMEKLLSPFTPYIYALLRVTAGLLFMQHGLQKLFGLLGFPQPVALASQMGMAGLIELVGGALIAIGLFASPVAFLASGQMAVAYFQVHAPGGFWPIQNGGELAVLYCWLFLFIAASGSGRLSIDAPRGRK